MKIRHLIAGAMMAATLPLGASAATVTDDSLLGLFGTPSIIGDLVVWNPSGSPAFSAQATAADSTAFTNSTFTLTVMADPGWWISGAAVVQDGTYFSFGTSSQVGVTGALSITAADPMGGLATWTGNIAATAPFVNGRGVAHPRYR